MEETEGLPSTSKGRPALPVASRHATRLDITVRPGEPTVVRLAGEIDLETAPRLRATLAGLVDAGARRLEVDAGEVTFMDSTGLHALVLARNACDGGLWIVHAPPGIERLLSLSGLASLLVGRPSAVASDAGQPIDTSAGEARTSPAG